MPSAQELLAARARRVTAIRRRVIAATLASFVLCWGAVAWDGSMGAETTTAAQTTTETTTEPSTTEPTDTSADDSASDQDDGAALSTSQS